MWEKAPPPSKRGTPTINKRSRESMVGWATIMDQVGEGDSKALADKEVFWQNQLRCYVQNGGNAHCYRKEK